MSTLIRYTLLRLLIFAVCFGVLWVLFGTTLVSNWLLALLALLFTSGLSMLLLRRQGTEAAAAMGEVVARARGRFESSVESSARKEDDDSDAVGDADVPDANADRAASRGTESRENEVIDGPGRADSADPTDPVDSTDPVDATPARERHGR